MYKKNKMKYGGMKKKKVMKASKGEMALKDFVEEGVFEPGSRAYEKVMQDEVDQAAKRYDMIKGAKKALRRIKKEKMKTGGMSKARGTGCAIRGTNFKGIF